ncbi:hypothetical protein HMPREF1624_00535 [Sporothrix schenckii ATCC 58251]|uniref:Methyltransferase domain-containing protein n=1 Tax=Sporothrix schenckii (strain ATCC 58251 / de Perez 2211183) TaxID=1391915 RepID=U7Q4W1_SPOS1|nr:hypothetical protein HMPREF1624_00535 [Sporothrix schenckii ATCC 58251]
MRPERSLPYADDFASADDYVEQLLHYVASTPVFQVLCGGVHIMDFYTTEPGLFYSVVPADWQPFLLDRTPMELLDFLLRDDVDASVAAMSSSGGRVPPPPSLVHYVHDVRRFSLRRNLPPATAAAATTAKLPRKITMGMNVKKIHEVTQFSEYVDRLADALSGDMPTTPITHLVDVGSGQNYLGRALASKLRASGGESRRLRRGVVAVESKGHNIAGAKGLDMMTGVMAAPVRPMRNKKLYQQQLLSQKGAAAKQTDKVRNRVAKLEREKVEKDGDDENEGEVGDEGGGSDRGEVDPTGPSEQTAATVPKPTIVADMRSRNEIAAEAYAQIQQNQNQKQSQKDKDRAMADEADNLIQYVEGRLENGDLSHVLAQVQPLRQENENGESEKDSILSSPSSFLTVSIHSCGNLSHYGLRALELNPAVRAVAIVGCCYNLLTERLGPPTYKVPGMQRRPTLQPVNGRVVREEERRDPEGFPMSERFAKYTPEADADEGIRFNITARMMACQAPANWTEAESEAFFTRHFYRAILQRIFLDRGVLQRVRLGDTAKSDSAPGDESDTAVTPVIVGSLRKACYASLPAYVRGAVAKMAAQGNGYGAASSAENAAVNAAVAEKMAGLTDADLEEYNARFGGNARRRRELSAVWSLMAFSAGVVESAIVADRWQYLRELQARGLVRDCWVESVFSYDQSPRNLVVVGIRGDGGPVCEPV